MAPRRTLTGGRLRNGRLRGGGLLLALLLSLPAAPAQETQDGANADERGQRLARQNYMLNCQGCHLPDGSGSPGNVPKLNDFVGYFLHVPGGREFIAQVPGVASAPISDAELAGVMNWMLLTFSAKELPTPFKPYSAAEIGALRKAPLVEVDRRRGELLTRIQDKLGVPEGY